jgi:hypothetical protein
MKFHVCRDDRSGRWVVRLNDEVYGTYFDENEALADAIDAARDARQTGREVQVWFQDRPQSERI